MSAQVVTTARSRTLVPTRARTRTRPTLPAFALSALLLHGLDAWVVQVEGDTGLGRRASYLAALAAGGALLLYVGRRSSSRVTALGLLATGFLGVVVLGPIVGSYINKQGVTGSRFTGILALLGALALTAVGTARLVRSTKRRWHRWLALPVGLLLLQFVALPLGSAVYTTNAARPFLGVRTPADIGRDFVDVTIVSGDGTELAAWYIPSGNGAAVLLRHGSGSTRTSTLDHAAFLAEAGYGVMLTDARGHGESDGRINELGWHGPQDITAAIDFLLARPDVTGGIGILGLSMGGEEAIASAAQDERIGAVVTEGAGIGSYKDAVAPGAHVFARVIDRTQYFLIELLSDAPHPDGIVASLPRIAPRPVLLITGDEAVEKKMGPVYAEAGGATTSLWELGDTPHTDGLEVYGAEYESRVTDVFDRALLD